MGHEGFYVDNGGGFVGSIFTREVTHGKFRW